MIGFFTTLTLTAVLAAEMNFNAVCTVDGNGANGFTGTLTLTLNAAANQLTVAGTILNSMSKWGAEEKHGVHVHVNGDVSNNCLNLGPHFDRGGNDPHGDVSNAAGARHFGDWGNAITDANGNLIVNVVDTLEVDLDELIGLTIGITKNADDLGKGVGALAAQSLIDGNSGAIVACCVITTPPPPATAAPVTTWNNAWPEGWYPPPGCNYYPEGYYYPPTTTTTTKATTTLANYPPGYAPVYVGYPPGYVAPPPPPPPPPVIYYAPGYTAPPPPPPPPPTTAPIQYCWLCPYVPPQYSGQSYVIQPWQWYGPCPTVASTVSSCVPSYYVRCSASSVMLGALAAIVAVLALLL